MAESNNSAGAVFIELGLDISQLESDFIAADRSIQQNLNRLNRESNLIQLRAEVEIGNLDATADATQILEIRQRALNQQMQIQRDRIRLTEAAFRDLTNTRGADAAETQRMEARLERERLGLQRLQQQLNQVTAAHENLNETQDNSGGSVESLQDRVQGLVDRALDRIPPAAKAAAVSVAGLAAGLLAAGNVTSDLIEKFRELQHNAYNLNMPIDVTDSFWRQMRMADTEVDDLMGYIRGMTDAYVKGEVDDPEFIALARYNTKIVDEQGRLLRFDQIVERVYQAYEQAKAEGNAIEFLQLTGGESGVTDAIRFFERYEEALEDAASIFDSGVDSAQLHEADRALMRLTEQVEEFSEAVADIITPASIKGMEALFETFHAGTKFVVENKSVLQDFAEVTLKQLATQAKMAINPLGTLADVLKDVYGKLTGKQDSEAIEKAALEAKKAAEAAKLEQEAAEKAQRQHQSMGDLQRDNETSKTPLSQYGLQRTKRFQDELEDLQIELDHYNNDYEQAIAEAEVFLKRELTDKLDVSFDEKLAVLKLHRAKLQKAETDREDALDDIRDEVAKDFRSDFENQLAELEDDFEDWLDAGMELEEAEKLFLQRINKAYEDHEDALQEIRDSVLNGDKTELQRSLDAIEKEKSSWIDDSGMDEAEAEILAQRKKADAIAALEEKFTNAVDALNNTALQNRLAQIEKEKQAWIDKGVAEVKATQWAEQAKVDAQRDAAMSVLKSQLKEYHAFQEGGYLGLRDYQLQQLRDAGISDKDLTMTPKQLRAFQQAQQITQKSLLPNFLTAQEYAYSNRLFDLDGSQRRLAAVQSKIAALNLQNMPEENLTDYGRSLLAQRDSLVSQLQNADIPNRQIQDFNLPIQLLEPTSLFPAADEFTSKFGEMSARISEVTSLLGDFGRSLNFPQQNYQAAPQIQAAPPNLTVTVQIEEAHAWDSQHIQELADLVADQITPELTRAIGGDSNGY